MKIGIVANKRHDPGLVFAKEVATWLVYLGQVPILEEWEAYRCDFLIVLGGDGTMLRAALEAAKYNTPMLGINLGNLGYLTDVERPDALDAIKKMLEGNFRRENRMMLECQDHLAMNEVVIYRDGSRPLVCRISVNGDHMDTLRADGMIISTPTGSTAYSLSAGGPILKPDSQMIVVTAVSPHTLYSRPWVLSGSDEVTLAPITDHKYVAKVSMDGEPKFILKCGESITVRRSEYTACVIKTSGMDFFQVLRKKMAKYES